MIVIVYLVISSTDSSSSDYGDKVVDEYLTHLQSTTF